MSGTSGASLKGRSLLRLFRSLLLLALVLPALTSCSSDRGWVSGSGTLELDEVDMASQIGGRLTSLTVNEGDLVHAGDTLAVLDRGEIAAELAAQIAQSQGAQAQAKDLVEGPRQSEVLTKRADVAAAAADEQFAASTLQRTEKLAKAQVVAQNELDRARAAHETAAARLRAAREQLRLLEEGYRRQQVIAARATAVGARAQLAGALSRASELILTAPIDGVVLLKNFEVGELVSPGVPVVTLGAPDSIWMRVYVAAPLLTRVKLGAPAEVRPVGSKRTYPARVVEIASRAEFTPRAALTEEEQANLVFGIKLVLAPTDGALKPGLPAHARIRAAETK